MSTDREMNEILQKFAEEYKQTIPEKIRALQSILDDMRRQITPKNLKELRFQIHKIAGSAGTYGFDSVSQRCRQWESDLLEKIESLQEGVGDPAWLEAFEAQFKQITKDFTAK